MILDLLLFKLGMLASAVSLLGYEFCAPQEVPRYIYAYWIPTLAFESVLCGMSIARGFQAFWHQSPALQSGKQLITILLRDSVIYFLMYVCLTERGLNETEDILLDCRIFLAYMVNCVLWATGVVRRLFS